MKEFMVRLFPAKSKQPKGIFSYIDNIFYSKPKPKSGNSLELKIGRLTKYGYKCVDVYFNNELIGEIRKKGIDELIEKGAFVDAKYHDENRITIIRLETHEYKDKPE